MLQHRPLLKYSINIKDGTMSSIYPIKVMSSKVGIRSQYKVINRRAAAAEEITLVLIAWDIVFYFQTKRGRKYSAFLSAVHGFSLF